MDLTVFEMLQVLVKNNQKKLIKHNCNIKNHYDIVSFIVHP
jgi:hypothetical protein